MGRSRRRWLGRTCPSPPAPPRPASDPADFANYLFIAPGAFPKDYDPTGGEAWNYAPDSGMDIEGVWQRTTGRPDVAGAIFDSGIRWESRDVSRTVLLNAGELPVPRGCASHDCDGSGYVDDIAGWDFLENDNDPGDDVEYGHGTG